MPTITVELFDLSVNSLTHPDVVRFRSALEAMAAEYGAKLSRFKVSNGVATFTIYDLDMCAEILRHLQVVSGRRPEFVVETALLEVRDGRSDRKKNS